MPPPPTDPQVDFDPADLTDPDVLDVFGGDTTDYTPGEYVVISPPDPLPLGFWAGLKDSKVQIRRQADGRTWTLRSEAAAIHVGTRPKRVLGFKTPQLPAGAYDAWCEYKNQNGEVRSLNIHPALAFSCPRRATRTVPVNLLVWFVGPATVPPLARTTDESPFEAAITVTSSNNLAVANLSPGQPPTVLADKSGPARFSLTIGSFGAAELTASAPGFDSIKFILQGVPSMPIPIVFVPGTAGIELDFADGTLYWIGLRTIELGTIQRGRLNADGSDTGQNRMTAKRPVASFSIPLDSVVQVALAGLGLPFQSSIDLKDIYNNFVAWMHEVLAPAADAPYDWRKAACPENDQLIDRAVQAALDSTHGEHTKVILLAHSLGGLVSRNYLAGSGQGKVDALIAAGTPWLGAPKTVRALMWGYDFDVGYTAVSPIYTTVTGLMGPLGGSRIYAPTRISLLDPSVTASLAPNFRAVFQQLPSDEFMTFYQEASQQRQRSVVFMMSPGEMKAFCRTKNPGMFDAVMAWRSRLFGHGNFGVAHYLIAALCDPACDISDRMDMEMAPPSQVNVDGNRADPGDIANAKLAHDRNQRIQTAHDAMQHDLGVGLFRYDYVTTDSDVSWGDGTAALLSATAGAQLKRDAPMREWMAERFLGPDTHITVVSLRKEFGHGTMLDDPEVQQAIKRIVRERNQLLGIEPSLQDQGLVSSITLELSTKDDHWNPLNDFGTFGIVTATLLQFDMELNRSRMELLSGSVSRWVFQDPLMFDTQQNSLRRLRNTDWPGASLVLRKPGVDDWTCVGIRVWLDAKMVLQDITEFKLTEALPSREFHLT